jgi:hypothetical protein
VLDGKFTTSGHLEAGLGQYLVIGPSTLWLLPVRGNPVLGPQHPSPSAEKVRERPLPLLVPRLGPVRPAQRHASARFQPAEEPPGDLVTAEPVEGVADDGQFEVARGRVEGLRVRRDRADVLRPDGICLSPRTGPASESTRAPGRPTWLRGLQSR